MGGAVFPPCCLSWDQTVVEVMKIMVTFFKRSHACTATLRAPTLQQATANPCLHQRLLNVHRQDWVSLLWGHCSFLLGPGAHKVLFVPSKSLFPQSCVSFGGSMVGLMVTSSKRAYVTPSSAAPRASAPAVVTVDLHLVWVTGDTQTLKGRSGLVSVGSPGAHKVLFEISEHCWLRGMGFDSNVI